MTGAGNGNAGGQADPGIALEAIDTVQPRLSDRVYEQIRDAIIAGRIPPSQRIVQDEIASKIRVSRTPVREALFRLEREGILQKSERNAFYTRSLSADEAKQIFQAREAVEGFAARLLAKERSPGKLAAVAEAVAAEKDIDRDDVVAVFEGNRAIHRAIVGQAGNDFLTGMFDSVWNLAISLPLFVASHVRQQVKAGDHDLLLEALRDAPPREAEQAMIDHIRAGLDNQLAAIREHRAGRPGGAPRGTETSTISHSKEET